MDESGAFVRFSFALLTAHHNERSFGTLAREICEEYTRQEGSEEYRCTSITGDSNKGPKNEGHEDDVGNMVEERKVVFNEISENGGEDPFGDNGGYNSHSYRCHNGAPNEPAQIDIAISRKFAQVANDTDYLVSLINKNTVYLRHDTYLSITRPVTSSMTAALTRIDPTRVWERLTEPDAELITANVVPSPH